MHILYWQEDEIPYSKRFPGDSELLDFVIALEKRGVEVVDKAVEYDGEWHSWWTIAERLVTKGHSFKPLETKNIPDWVKMYRLLAEG